MLIMILLRVNDINQLTAVRIKQESPSRAFSTLQSFLPELPLILPVPTQLFLISAPSWDFSLSHWMWMAIQEQDPSVYPNTEDNRLQLQLTGEFGLLFYSNFSSVCFPRSADGPVLNSVQTCVSSVFFFINSLSVYIWECINIYIYFSFKQFKNLAF